MFRITLHIDLPFDAAMSIAEDARTKTGPLLVNEVSWCSMHISELELTDRRARITHDNT